MDIEKKHQYSRSFTFNNQNEMGKFVFDNRCLSQADTNYQSLKQKTSYNCSKKMFFDFE